MIVTDAPVVAPPPAVSVMVTRRRLAPSTPEVPAAANGLADGVVRIGIDPVETPAVNTVDAVASTSATLSSWPWSGLANWKVLSIPDALLGTTTGADVPL